MVLGAPGALILVLSQFAKRRSQSNRKWMRRLLGLEIVGLAFWVLVYVLAIIGAFTSS